MKARESSIDAEDLRLDWEAKQHRLDITKAHCKRKREAFRRKRRARKQMRSDGQRWPRHEGDEP